MAISERILARYVRCSRKFVLFTNYFFLKMKQLLFVGIFLLATSCQFFDTEKITSETFYEQEMKTIDWKCVDQYPAFPNCENETEKAVQKTCFTQALSEHIYGTIAEKELKTAIQLRDTIIMNFSVEKNATLKVTHITIDSTLQQSFPLLEDWLMKSVEEIHLIAPAYKRGVPVQTRFTLPIVVQTGD